MGDLLYKKNLHMRFNLASVKQGTVMLSKKLSGADSDSNSLLEFPYQIYYRTLEDLGYGWHRVGEEPGEEDLVTYKDSTRSVDYKESISLSGLTYENVFLLKPGESAVIDLPDDTVDYYIVECGVNTAAYDAVKVNGETLTGTDTANPGRKDYATEPASMLDKPAVEFDNHVQEGAMRTLTVTKKLYDVNGTDLLHYDALEGETENKTIFNFRLFLGNVFTSEENIPAANLYTYYVKDRNGSYCRWDNSAGKFISLGITEYDGADGLAAYLATLTKAQQERIVFRTSPSGSVTKIPADYSVELRDLIIGTHWKVEEWDNEIPRGYTLRLEDGYTRTDGATEQKNGTTPIHDTMDSGETPEVNKVWTDQDFMEYHDPIYFAVYLESTETVENQDGTESENTTYTLLGDSVRQMPASEDSLYYYFGNLQSGVPFQRYKVFEVSLTGDIAVDEDGTVTGYDSVNRVENGGSLMVGGKPVGGAYHPTGPEDTGYTYTAAYERGEQTVQNENVRNDTVTNSRPGLKLFKTDWAGNELSGAVFTLTNEQGSDVAQTSYTSDSTGLITIVYLNPGTYTLTETAAPGGYAAPDSPVTIQVAEDGTITVSGVGEEFLTVTQAAGDDMASIVIKNRHTGLQVKKVDAATREPLQGVHFALYPQVTGADGHPRKDYNPKTGYEDLVTTENGILEEVNMTDLEAGTYYLTETQTKDGYDLPTEDLCFTIGINGTVSIVSGGSSSWLVRNEDAEGTASYILSIPNGKMKKVSVWKTDPDHTALTDGASFVLYYAEDYDDETGSAKEGVEPLLTGTTGPDGLLLLGELAIGEYRLVETDSPAGYNPLSSAIEIFVNADTVTAMQETGNSEVYTKGDPYWIADQDDNTWQIRVWNNPGAVLPSTGGGGVMRCFLSGGLLMLAAGGLLLGKRRIYSRQTGGIAAGNIGKGS